MTTEHLLTPYEHSKEVARDQSWIYLKRIGRKFFLEIHHDGGSAGYRQTNPYPIDAQTSNRG